MDKEGSGIKIQRNDDFGKNEKSRIVIIYLAIIGLVALLLRLNVTSFELPVVLDALLYFWYSIDMSQIGFFPHGYTDATNNGWPSFLSLFFSLFNSDNFLDYMNFQRILSITLSTLTIIPIFLLCNKFVEKKYAVFGAALFAFEPRVIQNSVFGITEPLFVLLLSISILMFLNNSKKIIFSSFGIIALTTMVRAEAIFLFLALSIMFFLRFRNEKTVIPKYIICLAIFVLILLPMLMIRMDTTGEDGVISRISSSVNSYQEYAENRGIPEGNTVILAVKGFENFFKFLGWSMIPTFLVFVPFGVYFVVRNRDYKKNTIIVSAIILSLPILYALSVASDSRYIFILYPLFCIASVFSIKEFDRRVGRSNLLIVIFLVGILISSYAYLDYKKIDLEYEIQSWELAEIIKNKTERINLYYPESKYLPISEFNSLQEFPIVRTEKNIPFKLTDYGVPITKNFETENELLKFLKNHEISHLVVDENEDENSILNNIFNNGENISYLKKEYDSVDDGFNYHLKIFKIDYEKFFYQNITQ